MKKTVLILSVFFCSFGGNAQQIVRLNPNEIETNETPQAVAYNFVMSIINEDYDMTRGLITPYFQGMIDRWAYEAGVPEEEIMSGKTVERLFSGEYFMNDIMGMRPVIKKGYDLVITDSFEEDLSRYFSDDENPYEGYRAYSVSFTCADAKDNIYDGKYGEYDITTRVVLLYQHGRWMVLFFK